eukprot:COSAG03_NODE_939_length_5261_cov_3.306470_6_plen_45_part_00
MKRNLRFNLEREALFFPVVVGAALLFDWLFWAVRLLDKLLPTGI